MLTYNSHNISFVGQENGAMRWNNTMWSDINNGNNDISKHHEIALLLGEKNTKQIL